MTLNTSVYVHDEIDAHEVFHFFRSLLGATDAHPWDERVDSWRSDGASTIANGCGIGLSAWLILHYRPGGPLRTAEQAAVCEDYCDADCDRTHHARPSWLEVTFDTAYAYRDEYGGCGTLHARLIAQLGPWLDERGVGWSWRNEFTGEVHSGDDRYTRLLDLACDGQAAEAWFAGVVRPAIERELDWIF